MSKRLDYFDKSLIVLSATSGSISIASFATVIGTPIGLASASLSLAFSLPTGLDFENKLNECIGKPKELWEALKSLGLPNKTSSCEVSALKVNKTVQHDTNLVLSGFKDYYSNLAGNLLKKLPKTPNKFTLNTVFQHYKGIIQSNSFNLATVSKNTIKYLKQMVWTIYLVVF